MQRTTYEITLTITHEDGKPIPHKLLGSQIEQGLEEGTSDYPSVVAALVLTVEKIKVETELV